MGYSLHSLALETTRRCNMRCKHCMRGESQNINLTKEIVDEILDNKEIDTIESICFSGGEPTLNPEIIIYTINKIIEEGLDIHELIMVTNCQIFDKELIDAFNRFNTYRNQMIKKSIIENYISASNFNEKLLNNQIETNTDNHVRITFSIDKYHNKANNIVREAYHLYSKGLKITEVAVHEEDVYKTGFADFGQEFQYKLEHPRYYKYNDSYWIMETLYVTATGYLTTEGMGEYIDMDRINMGHISEISIKDILIKYGKPVFKTTPISEEKNVLVKK